MFKIINLSVIKVDKWNCKDKFYLIENLFVNLFLPILSRFYLIYVTVNAAQSIWLDT